MKQRKIGNTGITVSALGLGCNNFGLRIDGPGVAVLSIPADAIDYDKARDLEREPDAAGAAGGADERSTPRMLALRALSVPPAFVAVAWYQSESAPAGSASSWYSVAVSRLALSFTKGPAEAAAR